jgi:hypothetical protein
MPLVKRTNAVVVEAPKQDAPTPEQTAKVAEMKTVAKKSASTDTMSKADWAAKDQRISRQGLFQAALQSVGLLQLNTGNTLEDYLTLVEQTAERGIVFANKQ